MQCQVDKPNQPHSASECIGKIFWINWAIGQLWGKDAMQQGYEYLLYWLFWPLPLQVQQLSTCWVCPAGDVGTMQIDLRRAAAGMSQLHHGLVVIIQIHLNKVLNADIVPPPLHVQQQCLPEANTNSLVTVSISSVSKFDPSLSETL